MLKLIFWPVLVPSFLFAAGFGAVVPIQILAAIRLGLRTSRNCLYSRPRQSHDRPRRRPTRRLPQRPGRTHRRPRPLPWPLWSRLPSHPSSAHQRRLHRGTYPHGRRQRFRSWHQYDHWGRPLPQHRASYVPLHLVDVLPGCHRRRAPGYLRHHAGFLPPGSLYRHRLQRPGGSPDSRQTQPVGFQRVFPRPSLSEPAGLPPPLKLSA